MHDCIDQFEVTRVSAHCSSISHSSSSGRTATENDNCVENWFVCASHHLLFLCFNRTYSPSMKLCSLMFKPLRFILSLYNMSLSSIICRCLVLFSLVIVCSSLRQIGLLNIARYGVTPEAGSCASLYAIIYHKLLCFFQNQSFLGGEQSVLPC